MDLESLYVDQTIESSYLSLFNLKLYAEKNELIRKHYDISVKIFVYDMNDTISSDSRLFRFLSKEKPDLIGFSCFLWNIDLVINTSKIIKKILPSTLIILGGPEVDSRSKQILSTNKCIDVVIKKNSETAFSNLLVNLIKRNTKDLSSVPDITYKKGDKIIDNEEASCQKLDGIPSVYLSNKIKIKNKSKIYLELSRGCSSSCSYCFYHQNMKKQYFPFEKVKKELEYIFRFNPSVIYFLCSDFGSNKEYTLKLCNLFEKLNKNRKVKTHIEARIDLLDKETIYSFKKLNIDFIEVGVQSIHPDTLRNINRSFNKKRFIENYILLKKLKINVQLQLIYGLPGDNYAKFVESFEFIHSLNPKYIYLFPLLILPGSQLSQETEKFQIVHNPSPPYNLISNFSFSSQDMEKARLFSKKKLNKAYLKARIPFFWKKIKQKIKFD